MTDKPKDTVINFSERVKKLRLNSAQDNTGPEADEPLTTNELMTLGTEAFLEDVSEAKAFIAITFDSENKPNILHVGDIDLINAIGALEYAKNDILNNNFDYDA